AFELVFTPQVYEHLLIETGNYASFLGEPDPQVTLSELKCFLGILIVSGYNSIPQRRGYWSNSPSLRNDLISSSLPRNRFETILKFIHCADNRQPDLSDRLWKLRPLMELVRKQTRHYFIPESPFLNY